MLFIPGIVGVVHHFRLGNGSLKVFCPLWINLTNKQGPVWFLIKCMNPNFYYLKPQMWPHITYSPASALFPCSCQKTNVWIKKQISWKHFVENDLRLSSNYFDMKWHNQHLHPEVSPTVEKSWTRKLCNFAGENLLNTNADAWRGLWAGSISKWRTKSTEMFFHLNWTIWEIWLGNLDSSWLPW